MDENVLRSIENSNAKVVIFDIDGTLKDLCKEHNIALCITLKDCNVGGFRKKLVGIVNKIAMLMVKTGLVSTNHSKQRMLLGVFSILSGIKRNKFSIVYFENYAKQICLFESTDEILQALNQKMEVYFSTINKQNYNLEMCGIPQERIVYTEGKFKTFAYRKILKSIGAKKKDVIVVGDNIFDDLLAAKFLGIKCLLVNRYGSKLKSVFCRLVNSKYSK